jgi:hypothetical protein
MKKITLISGLILTLILSQVASAAFSDVDETTDYRSSITWMADNGVIQGYPDGTFKPDQCVNRAEFLKMLYLTSKKNVESLNPTQNNIFSDTSVNEWYWPYVSQAISDETVEGYPDGTFKPAQCVNRVEAIKMAVLEFDLYDENADMYGHSGANPRDIDLDEWYASYFWSAQHIEALGLEHITIEAKDSMPLTYFYPGDPMTRKEVAEMLYRMKTIKDNSLEIYSDQYKPDPLNFYVSPTSGVSFMMTDGWEVISDVYYETESYTAEYPTIMIENSETEELLGINVRMMQCEGPLAVACYELAEGYTLGAPGEQELSPEGLQLVNRMLLTFRVPDGVSNVQSYSNSEFGLSFNYPNDWSIVNENVNDMGTFSQLQIELSPDDNSDVVLGINTPLREIGFEGYTVESGFEREISGLISSSADLLRNNDINRLIAKNIYYKDTEDFENSIEFILAASGDVFDNYAPDYYVVLDSVNFN